MSPPKESTNTMITVKKKAELRGHQGSIYKISSGSQPNSIITLGGDGNVVEWDLDNAEDGILKAKSDYKFFSGLYHMISNACYAGDMNGSVYQLYFDRDRGEVNAWKTHQKGTFAIAAIEGKLISGGGDGTLTKWNTDPFFPKVTNQISGDRIRALIWDKDRELIGAGSSDGNIYWVEPQNLRVVDVVEQAHESTVFSMVLANRELLITGGRDAFIHFWKYPSMELIHRIPAHLFTINDLAMSPCGRFVASGSRDKEVRIWQLADFQLVKVIDRIKCKGHVNSVNSIYWDSVTGLLATGGDDCILNLWEVTSD